MLSILVPTHPRSAGSSVSEPRIIISTPMAEAMATPVTKLRPMRVSPSSEMITVMPAKSTARPLVSIDSATASSTPRPSLSPSR